VFGPVVVAGLGGVQAELWRDTALELAPVTTREATAMLARLRAHPLLTGWRGAPATAVGQAAEVIAALSRYAVDHPDVAECEINPLRVGTGSVLAVDALITVSG
jgi:succinyl-CoA synthetase beta subunit